jgi:alkanesulfonate monooxygenase SsuD/methylene tetrahydromethanopterin reductase-like flavin-dependent oxidoreductase (luciferase family)
LWPDELEVTVKIGVTLPMAQDDGSSPMPSYRDIRSFALAAETAGLDSIWGYDHLLFRDADGDSGIHECWTVMAAVAEATSRVQLGILVMCTAFRNPALLAKMAATLDHVSGGRLILGIGCGWHDPEFDAFGYPTDHKVGRFEEALLVIRALIRDGRADLDGRWVQARDAVLAPPARPDLPILIAAKRPRMLELTARHADIWNEAWLGPPDERWARMRRDLDAACRAVGRDPATLERTVGVNVRIEDLLPGVGDATRDADPDDEADAPEPSLHGDAAEIAAGMAAYAADGTRHLIAALEPKTPAAVERFTDAVRIVRAAGAA